MVVGEILVVDLTIVGGRIVTSTRTVEAGVAINDGKIVAIGKEATLPKSQRVIDAKGKLLLPGLIDPHVHFRDPGFPQKGDFTTESKAAAAGGVTTIMDMPNTKPVVDCVEVFEEKRKIAESKSIVDFALIGGVGSSNVDEIPKLAEAGAVYFKTFMGGYGLRENPELSKLLIAEDNVLLQALRKGARTGLVQAVHAEDNDLVNFFVQELINKGKIDLKAFFESRPNIVEDEATSRAILLAENTGCRIHFVHMSSSGAAELVRNAKLKGLAVTSETCVHYLMLTSEDALKAGPYGIMVPPLRSSKDVEALWKAIQNGAIDMIGSDHAPHTVEEKQLGLEDVWKTPLGCIGVETTLPLLLTKVNEGRIGLQRLVELTSTNAAKLFSLYPTKGTIEMGSDADLAIVDLKKKKTIRQEELHSKIKVSLFNGLEVKGVPTTTILRGTIIMEEGEVTGVLGQGRFVKPSRVR